MVDKQLKDKAITFKGSDYVQVKDRVLYLADNFEWRYEIDQDYSFYEESKTWVVKTVLTIWDEKHEHSCKYVWLAQEVEWTSFINKTSALENCSTSSLWRAVACLWIWVIDSFASINEIEKAENRLNQKPDLAKFTDTAFNKFEAIHKQYADWDEAIAIIRTKYVIDQIMEAKVRALYK